MPLVKVLMRKQIGNNTCWAACAQMVLETYGYEQGTSQSAVVQEICGTLQDFQGTPTEIGGVVARFSGKRVHMDQFERALTIEELKARLANKCLVVADVGRHVVIVHGVGNTSGKVWVSDPDGEKKPPAGDTGGQEIAYEEFVKNWKASAAVFSWESKDGASGSSEPKDKQRKRPNE